MTTGRKIEKLRKQYGFTTDELAKKLNVSRQTIYKWETESVFPDLDHLKKLAVIFETTTDYLLYDTQPKPPVKRVNEPEAKPRGAEQPAAEFICMTCGKIIRKGEPSFPAENYERVRSGKRSRSRLVASGRECASCDNKRTVRIEKEKEEKKKEKNKEIKARRVWNFIALAVLLGLTLGIYIPMYVQGFDSRGVTVFLVIGLLTTFAVPTLILNNTFITDVFLEIVTWGIVKFPGIIFSLDLGGVAFFIILKIVFFILGLVLIAGSIGLALMIAGTLSIFVYPIALKRNFKGGVDLI